MNVWLLDTFRFAYDVDMMASLYFIFYAILLFYYTLNITF